MGELMPNPKASEPGRFLQPGSVFGDRVYFVNPSSIATGRLNLAVAGDGSLNDFGSFSISLSIRPPNGDNIYDWDSVVAWNYCDYYIDGASSTVFLPGDLWPAGSDINTRGKRSLIFTGPHYNTNPDVYSHMVRWHVQNMDSSTHTVDIVSQWKYIRTGNTFAVTG